MELYDIEKTHIGFKVGRGVPHRVAHQVVEFALS
jgi:hypothetical protein